MVLMYGLAKSLAFDAGTVWTGQRRAPSPKAFKEGDEIRAVESPVDRACDARASWYYQKTGIVSVGRTCDVRKVNPRSDPSSRRLK